MKLRDYIRGLTPDQLAAYAESCGTTPDYIKVHLVYANKTPRRALMMALAYNSGGSVTEIDVLQHFGLLGRSDDSSIEPPAAA